MKIKPTIFIALLVLCGKSQAQGFIDLNFEAANVSGYSPGSSDVPISDALPGWSADLSDPSNTYVLTQVWYDGISTGGAGISVVDTNTPYGIFSPIAGQYSALLFGAYYTATISQSGLVPTGTQSLLFDAYVYGASFSVSLGGQNISMIPLETFSNYTLYGGNIPSEMAGQMETLSFTMPPPANSPPSMFELDNIQFSPTLVPEPSALGLFVLCGLFLTWRYRQTFFKTKT